jgi:MoxR-like ATPase
MRHRIIVSYEALSDGVTSDDIIRQILKAVPAPQKVLEAHVRVA